MWLGGRWDIRVVHQSKEEMKDMDPPEVQSKKGQKHVRGVAFFWPVSPPGATAALGKKRSLGQTFVPKTRVFRYLGSLCLMQQK